MQRTFWKDKRVFLTGHTGFKGGWLAIWLSKLGAHVYGYSLEPPTQPNLFSTLKLSDRLTDNTIADIRDANVLSQVMVDASPDIVFHMAAQPLVRHSYSHPTETYSVNVMGTVNLFEAVRKCKSVRAVVNITTDKCYENREWVWAYRETEALGGFDPYSSSKACSELVTAAYRRSFLAANGVHVASARAGNVIGGGDWAEDRLIPDFLRAIDAGEKLNIRFPNATRPWQHVLEPLSGYLTLAQSLYEGQDGAADAWNFGPIEQDARSVEWIAEHLCNLVPSIDWVCDNVTQPHEANFLKLDISKTKHMLHWQPRWKLEDALRMTLNWHNAWRSGADMYEFSLEQINIYEASKCK